MDEGPQESASQPAVAVDMNAVACPGAQPTGSALLSGLGERAALEAYLLDTRGGEDDDGGAYCLRVALLDRLPAPPTEVTIEAPSNRSNYAETYTTGDREGSDEITYFPFVVKVYGGCRRVAATMMLADGTSHGATLRVGTGCPT